MKVKILFHSGSETSYISRRAQNTLNLTPLNSEKLEANTFGSENSKAKTVQRVNFFIETANKKLIEAEAYTAPFLFLSFAESAITNRTKTF